MIPPEDENLFARQTEEGRRLFTQRKPGTRLVGLDVGQKTLGTAVGDARWCLATPLKTIARARFGPLMEDLTELLKGYEIAAFVVGLPLNMDGSQGARAQASLAFGQNLEETLGLPVLYWDERLTTQAATWSLQEAGIASKKHKKSIDSMAASLILQGILDSLKTQNAENWTQT